VQNVVFLIVLGAVITSIVVVAGWYDLRDRRRSDTEWPIGDRRWMGPGAGGGGGNFGSGGFGGGGGYDGGGGGGS
jgi:uncharacterized membrane protein YgcG